MIVYVESNFILELAYLQEQQESCRATVELAEAGSIRLVLPAFSISEPYESFVRRYKERRALLDRLQREIRELSRSQPYTGVPEESAAITATFVRSLEEEKERLDEVTLRILRCAESIPTTADVLARAIEFQRGLIRSPQDAIVYASVLSHLERAGPAEKCFLNRNAGDFADPDVEETLTKHRCKLLARFDHGLGYIRSQMASR
ncbi:hypothetical protein BH24GEM3_BH24GEM3_24750 [soil metagenome]|jgi:predicted nucleic acid-binding protein